MKLKEKISLALFICQITDGNANENFVCDLKGKLNPTSLSKTNLTNQFSPSFNFVVDTTPL
jgi:hypothetical protein